MRNTLLLSALLLASTGTAFADGVRHHFEASSTQHVRRLRIEIPTGEIRVRNTQGDLISVSGEARRNSVGGNQQAIVDDSSLEFVTSGDTATLRRHFGPDARGWASKKITQFDVTITVPEGTALDFETSAGSVDLDGTFGDVDLDMWAGEIHVRTPRQNIRELYASCRVGEVHAALGDSTVDREGIFPGRTHFSNENGKTDMTLHVTAGEVHVTLTR